MKTTNKEIPNSSWLKTFSIGFSIISFGITIAIIGYIVLTTRETQPPNQQPIIPIDQPSPTLALNYNENWKTFRFSDESGFGYEIKLPPDWCSRIWGGGHADPEPLELAQGFYKNCGGNDQISVLHFISDGPSSKITTIIANNEKAIGGSYTTTTTQNPQGINIKRLIADSKGNLVYGAYIVSERGYYQIFAKHYGAGDINRLLDQILSTFKFTQ